MVEYLCIIQARVNSTRLPSKVMLDLAGKTLLERVYDSISKSKKITKIVVATSTEETDDIIELKCNEKNFELFRGSLNNVLDRFYKCASIYNSKNIVRITADNPLMDGKILDQLINIYEDSEQDYSMFTNAVYGLSGEVFSFSSLEEAYKCSRDNYDREHVTTYIRNVKNTYILDIENKYKKPYIRATIDTLDDYIKIQKFFLNCKYKNIEANIDNFILYEEKNV